MSYAYETSDLIEEIKNLKDLTNSRLGWQEVGHFLQEAIDQLEWIKEEEEEEE